MDQTSIFAQRIYPGRRTDAPPSALMGVSTIITYNAEVIALRRSGDDARVLWRDRASSAEQTTEAPFCAVHDPGSRR